MMGGQQIVKPSKIIQLLFCIICCFSHVTSLVQELNDDSWDPMLKGEWMVEFIAPWCPACQQLEPIWDNFANEININVGRVDITKNPGLSGRFGISTLPTIFHVKDAEFRQYRGSKDKESFKQFVYEKQWKKLDPVPFWKSPQSFVMSAYGLLHRMSLWIMNLYKMMVDYGIPLWGIVLIFALATILLGSFLGLQIVLIIDTFYRIFRSNSGAKTKESESEHLTKSASGSANEEDDEASNQAEFDDDTESEDEDESCEQSQSDELSRSEDEEGILRRRNVKADDE